MLSQGFPIRPSRGAELSAGSKGLSFFCAQTLRARLITLGVCWLLLSGMLAWTRPARADDEEALERFLARLGLADLQIVHLEKSLDSPTLTQPARQRLAERLADLYAERLMKVSDDPARYGDLTQRIDALLAKFPQANTASLRVMLLQADYHRAEGQIAQWFADPTKQSALDDARETLQTIAPQLDQYQHGLNSQIEALYIEIEKLSDTDPELIAKENEARRLQAIWGRASYFAGWSNYYLGLAKNAGDTEYRRASEIFRKVLAVDDASYGQLDAASLSLEVPWRARAVIGLGLVETSLGNLDASRALFAALEHPSTPPEIIDQASYWRAQGMINAGRWSELREFAQEYVGRLSGNPTQGKVSLCAALVRTGFGPSSRSKPDQGQELGMLGITGLARLGQYNAVQQLIDQYDIQIDDGDGFFLQWMRGRQRFTEAQKSKQPADYLAAAQILLSALKQPDAAPQVLAAGQCRYELGWCYYRAGDFEAAARQFQQAATSLKATGASEAVNAAWMAFVAYQQLAEKQPRFVSSAIDVLQGIKRDFPRHEYAQNADYYIARIQRAAGSPMESIRQLNSIPATDPNYLTARYDLSVLLHQQWSESETTREKSAAFDGLRQAADEYLRAAGAQGDKEKRLRVMLLVVAAAVGGNPANAELAAEWLAKASSLADVLLDGSAAKAEFHYRQLQTARLNKDGEAALSHAKWLAEHAGGTAYEMPALIEVSREATRQLENASDANRRDLQNEAHSVYTRLVGRLGASAETLKSQKNARVALARLAEYAYATERYEEAAQHLALLLSVDPKNEEFLRLAGLANFQAGQYELALGPWRTLAQGLSRGSDNWFEAKYYQIASLIETDATQARKTFENFKLFYPEYGPEPWRDKFELLARRLK